MLRAFRCARQAAVQPACAAAAVQHGEAATARRATTASGCGAADAHSTAAAAAQLHNSHAAAAASSSAAVAAAASFSGSGVRAASLLQPHRAFHSAALASPRFYARTLHSIAAAAPSFGSAPCAGGAACPSRSLHSSSALSYKGRKRSRGDIMAAKEAEAAAANRVTPATQSAPHARSQNAAAAAAPSRSAAAAAPAAAGSSADSSSSSSFFSAAEIAAARAMFDRTAPAPAAILNPASVGKGKGKGEPVRRTDPSTSLAAATGASPTDPPRPRRAYSLRRTNPNVSIAIAEAQRVGRELFAKQQRAEAEAEAKLRDQTKMSAASASHALKLKEMEEQLKAAGFRQSPMPRLLEHIDSTRLASNPAAWAAHQQAQQQASQALTQQQLQERDQRRLERDQRRTEEREQTMKRIAKEKPLSPEHRKQIHRLGTASRLNPYADLLMPLSQADRDWFENQLIPAFASQPWLLCKLEYERRKLSHSVFEFFTQALRAANQAAEQAAVEEAKWALRSPAEQQARREFKAKEEATRVQRQADLDAYLKSGGSRLLTLPHEVTWPADSPSPFAGRTLPFPKKIVVTAIYKDIQSIFTQANSTVQGVGQAERQAGVASSSINPSEARIQELFEEFKARLFALLSYDRPLVPPAPVHYMRHLLEPIAGRQKLYRLGSSLAPVDAEIMQQLYVLLPTHALRVLVRLLQRAPLPPELGRNRIAIEAYVQKLLDAEPARLSAELHRAGKTLAQVERESQVVFASGVANPIPQLLPFLPFVDPQPLSRTGAVETSVEPMGEAQPAIQRVGWIEGDRERMEAAVMYLFNHALTPPAKAAPMPSVEAGANFVAPPSSKPTRELILFQARLRQLSLLWQQIRRDNRLARWSVTHLKISHKEVGPAPAAALVTPAAAAIESSAPTVKPEGNALADNAVAVVNTSHPADAPQLPSSSDSTTVAELTQQLRGLKTRVTPQDNPEARHVLLHRLCARLLPSQTRAISLLFHLFNSKVTGHALFSLLNRSDDQSASKRKRRLNSSSQSTNPAADLDLEASALADESHKFRDSLSEHQLVSDAQSVAATQPEHEANVLLALSDETKSTSKDRSGQPVSRRQEYKEMFALLEQMVVADVASHLQSIKAAEAAALQSSAAQLMSGDIDHDALRKEQFAAPTGGMARLSDAQNNKTSKLIASTIMDKTAINVAAGPLNERERNTRYGVLMRELTRILGPLTPSFLDAFRESYLHLTCEELEAVREKYPESELQPYVAFKVHQTPAKAQAVNAIAEVVKPTPFPARDEQWFGAIRTAETPRVSAALADPAPAVPAVSASSGSMRTADELLDDLFPEVTAEVRPDAPSFEPGPALIRLPEYDTPVVTLPARVVYLLRSPYLNQWRTSFGQNGSFDFLPPLRVQVPALSFSNDVNSTAAHTWFGKHPDSTPLPHKLYLRNLHPEMSAAELLYAFKHIGEIVGGEIHREVLRADLSAQAHHLLESKKSKETRNARQSKVMAHAAKSPVYAFLYFSTAEALARATTASMRLFGLNAKGYTMYPEPASDKRTLYMQFSATTIHQHFHHYNPTAHTDVLGGTIDDIAAVDAAAAAAAAPSSAAASSSSSPSNVLFVNSLSTLHRRASLSAIVKDFTMSRIQRDIYALLARSGLSIAPYANVKLSSKATLYNHAYVLLECTDHALADKVFEILQGQTVAEQQVVLAWAQTRPEKLEAEAYTSSTTGSKDGDSIEAEGAQQSADASASVLSASASVTEDAEFVESSGAFIDVDVRSVVASQGLPIPHAFSAPAEESHLPHAPQFEETTDASRSLAK